jgi:hypothetical protein
MHHPARLAAISLVLVLVAMSACSGCAGTSKQLKTHSVAAETLDDLAARGRMVVLELRQAALDAALAKAQEANQPYEPAVRAAAEAFDAKPYIPALNTFVEAKNAYVRIVLIAARKDDFDWTSVRPAVKDVADAYAALRTATGDKMPPIPKVVTDILSP